MSLDVSLSKMMETSVYEANITHNLCEMAIEAGIYLHLWHPDQIGISVAEQLVEPLAAALTVMRNDPERFRQHNPPNGWGSYESFKTFVEAYLNACKDNPSAKVNVSI